MSGIGTTRPILRSGAESNFVECRKSGRSEAIEIFGHLGKVLVQEEYWEPEGIDVDRHNASEDPHGFGKSILSQRLKDRQKLVDEMKANRPKLYAFIWRRLSAESQEEITRTEGFDAEASEASGNQGTPDTDKALDLLVGLDNARYEDLEVEVINDTNRGVMEVPANAMAVYLMACRRIKTYRRAPGVTGGAAFSTMEKKHNGPRC